MNATERTLILGALLHDIGKFEQRCTRNPGRKKHQELGAALLRHGRFIDLFQKIVGAEQFENLCDIVANHHGYNPAELTAVVKEADHLSASERVEKEEPEPYQGQWGHTFLCSLFSKIKLLSEDSIDPRYYKHQLLTGHNYNAILPLLLKENDMKTGDFSYTPPVYDDFLNDLHSVLSLYRDESDFESLINLLLIVIEKYMWCIPDFTGSSQTDISLSNHLKDVAGLAHAIYKTQAAAPGSPTLNLVIGDMPGIQKYIFDDVNRKPAKILRGRSIFVQVLTRNLATKMLKAFGLSEASLIMLAGGKFYILAPDTEAFRESFNSVVAEIEDFLIDNYRMELQFNCAYHTFNYRQLKTKELTFGEIIEEASFKLLRKKHLMFNSRLFAQNPEGSYVWQEEYIAHTEGPSDSIKCRVTDKPIRANRAATIPEDGDTITVDKQVKAELEIGGKIPGNNICVAVGDNLLEIDPDNIAPVGKFRNAGGQKLLLNPDLDALLKAGGNHDIFRNTHYLYVANYCSIDEQQQAVLPFDELEKTNTGAQFLCLVKGDIDNLGLIMAYGLSDDEKSLTAISRTTTLSNHLKYFFSSYLNGLLKGREAEAPAYKVYTIFAGGDDLMLISPQCSALELVDRINRKFGEFACENPEVHISFSVTHFKHATPIRLVADFAEENQALGKKHTREKQRALLHLEHNNSFKNENDKDGTWVFNSFIKNKDLPGILEKVNVLTLTLLASKDGISVGILRKLLELAEKRSMYNTDGNPAHLIAFARMSYTINRLLKDSGSASRAYLERLLQVAPEKNSPAETDIAYLYPVICQTIYAIRN